MTTEIKENPQKLKIKIYETKMVHRRDFKEAEYNPRTITDKARDKIKKSLKKHGLVKPLIMNRRTGNLVEGHQRIDVIDDIQKNKDYMIPVSIVDISLEEEIALNAVLNNESVMGEWNVDGLLAIKQEYPEIDFEKDMLFDKFDIDYMFSGSNDFDNISAIFQEPEEKKEIIADIEKMKEIKAAGRKKAKEVNENGVSHNVEKNDYMVTLVFNNNKEKWNFMTSIKKSKTEKFIEAKVLYGFMEGLYKMDF